MKRAIKRLTAVVLAVIITASLFTSAFAVLRGDVDLNGKINSLDALRILRYNVQLDTEIDEKIALFLSLPDYDKELFEDDVIEGYGGFDHKVKIEFCLAQFHDIHVIVCFFISGQWCAT